MMKNRIRGVTAPEYGVIGALIALVILVAVGVTGINLSCLYFHVASKIGQATGLSGIVTGSPAACDAAPVSQYPPGSLGAEFSFITGPGISSQVADLACPATPFSQAISYFDTQNGVTYPAEQFLPYTACGWSSNSIVADMPGGIETVYSAGSLVPSQSAGNYAGSTYGWIFETGPGTQQGAYASVSYLTQACLSRSTQITDTFFTTTPPYGATPTAKTISPAQLTQSEQADLGIPAGASFPAGTQFVICQSP